MPHYVNGKPIPVVGNDKENLAVLNKPKEVKPAEDKPTPPVKQAEKKSAKKKKGAK